MKEEIIKNPAYDIFTAKIKSFVNLTPLVTPDTSYKNIDVFRKILDTANISGFWWGKYKKDNN